MFAALLACAALAPVGLGAAPLDLTVAGGSLWVLAENDAGAVVLRLDPASDAKLGVVRVGPAGPDLGRLAVGLGRVWAVAGHGVLRIDPAHPRVAARARLPGVASAVAVGYGSVWVTTVGPTRDLLVRLDPRSLRVVARIGVGRSGASAVVAALGSVWVAGGSQLVRVDPRTDGVAALLPSPERPVGLAAVAGRIWALGERTLAVLDRHGRAIRSATLPVAVGAFAVARDGLWATDACGCRRGTLVELDRRGTRILRRMPTGETPVAVAVDSRRVWVASFGDGTIATCRR